MVLSTFALVDIRNESVAPTPSGDAAVDTDVRSNERPFDGRVYVLDPGRSPHPVLEHTAHPGCGPPVHRHNLDANDLMAVVSTGARAQDAPEFTNNKRLLLAAVDGLLGQKMDSAAVSRNTGFQCGDSSPARPDRGSQITTPSSVSGARRWRSTRSARSPTGSAACAAGARRCSSSARDRLRLRRRRGWKRGSRLP